MKVRSAIPNAALMLAAAAKLLSAPVPTAGETANAMYDMIRRNDIAAMQAMMAADKAAVNVTDGKGSTPLMHAAAVGSLEMMRVLAGAGANVQARNGLDQTALHWAARDLAKVQMLAAQGADVNAVSRMGRTPLMVAASYAGNEATVRFLLARGADAKIADKRKMTALHEASRANDMMAVRQLVDAGADVKSADGVGFTALHWAAAWGNAAMARLLMDHGADVNAVSGEGTEMVKNGRIALGQLTPLHLAASSGSNGVTEMLLEAKAKVNLQDVRGMTPLMLAVATDRPNAATLKMLMAHGADPSIRAKSGESYADWARKYQAAPAMMTRMVAVKENSAREAAAKAIRLLESSAATSLREGGCLSCHSANLVTLAATTAAAHGVAHDRAALAEQQRSTVLQFAGFREVGLERVDLPAPEIVTYALFAAAVSNREPDRITDGLIVNLMGQQFTDGRINQQGVARAPMHDGGFAEAAMGILALKRYGPPALKGEVERRIDMAKQWLMSATPLTTEDAVMQLLGAKWAGMDSAVIERLARNLRTLQRKDGGWGQTPRLNSDAYATGTALYALHEGAGMAAMNPVYQRGVRFLLATQKEDGSWFVASRAPKIQPYFEGGFPYGHDQWISQSATAWASTALAQAVEVNREVAQK